MTHSQTANRLGLSNKPTEAIINVLQRTALGLEDVRQITGPIVVSSGYRSAAVNKAVGGASNSQHLTGEAADITCPSIGTLKLMRKIVDSNIKFDQCILEYASGGGGWVHVSFNSNPRRQALIVERSGTTIYV